MFFFRVLRKSREVKPCCFVLILLLFSIAFGSRAAAGSNQVTQGLPPVGIEVSPEVVFKDSIVKIRVSLGSAADPVTNFSGIGFELHQEDANFSLEDVIWGGFPGTEEEVITFSQKFPDANHYGLSVTRKGDNGVDGYGDIVTIMLKTEEVPAGHYAFELAEILVIDSNGMPIDISAPEAFYVSPPSYEIRGNAGWRMLSSPVLNRTIEHIATQNQVQGIPGIADFYENPPEGIEEAEPNIFTGYENEQWIPPAHVSDPIAPGQGFIWYLFDNDQGMSTPLPFNFMLQGDFYSEDVVVNLHQTGDHYNLLGNPYPFDLDISSLSEWTSPGSLSSSVAQIWINDDAEHQGYWKMAGAGNENKRIPAWMGFMVENQDASEITIPDSAILPHSINENAGESYPKLTLIIDGYNHNNEVRTTDQVILIFSEDAEEGWDLLDATKMTPLSDNYATLAFVGEKNNDILLKAQESRPIIWEGTKEIPLSFDVNQMEGSFTIHWEGLEGIPSHWNFSLYDNESDQITDLRSSHQYVFSYTQNPSSQKVVDNPAFSPQITPLAFSTKDKTEDLSNTETRFNLLLSKTPVSGDEQNALPENVKLGQNYPNPFNPATHIHFSLPAESHVSLSVYNILGQKVAQLVNESRVAGEHVAIFNAEGLSSGLYFYTLQAGSFVETRQMTLVK